MGTLKKYMELLYADDEKVKDIIEKMSEKNAKEILTVFICKDNAERGKNLNM